ncbi:MAG: aspartate aminotransferase family protein [Actinomycetes bacterium]
MSAREQLVDRTRLQGLIASERAEFAERNAVSKQHFEAADEHLWTGVPMAWMAKWPGGFPLSMVGARGARVVDVDGHEYIDFCLGDTGAMAGHSAPATVAAVERRAAELGGITTMLPTEDATWVAGDLAKRFGLPQWSFTLSATDANRFALRKARQLTGRPLVLCFSWCYHGSVDETVVVLAADGARSRPGNVGPAVDPTETTRVCEFNDLEAVERLLADRQVACVITEPALTNIGIVLPEPGFMEGLRELTRQTDTLLIIDETHTLSAGPGGCTKAWGLDPDIVTIGKAIGGGIPIGAYGMSAAVAEQLKADEDADFIDTGGVGGTLAGNALSLAAAHGTLDEVLTASAFERMEALATRFTAGVDAAIERYGAPWVCVQLGARTEYRFMPEAPRNGGESAAADDPELDEWLHLYMLNRNILMTPFHNMALICPTTTEADVDRHSELFDRALASLFG